MLSKLAPSGLLSTSNEITSASLPTVMTSRTSLAALTAVRFTAPIDRTESPACSCYELIDNGARVTSTVLSLDGTIDEEISALLVWETNVSVPAGRFDSESTCTG